MPTPAAKETSRALAGSAQDLASSALLLVPVLQDAVGYFESALALDPQDSEAAAGLQACSTQLAALAEARRVAAAAASDQWQAAQAQEWQQP